MLFSHVKISSFRTKAHLVFHWWYFIGVYIIKAGFPCIPNTVFTKMRGSGGGCHLKIWPWVWAIIWVQTLIRGWTLYCRKISNPVESVANNTSIDEDSHDNDVDNDNDNININNNNNNNNNN